MYKPIKLWRFAEAPDNFRALWEYHEEAEKELPEWVVHSPYDDVLPFPIKTCQRTQLPDGSFLHIFNLETA